MSVLSVDRCSYRYPGSEVPGLEDVSLTVGAGELVVVTGLSGSGKSTLLRACSGLVPHFHGGTFGGRVVVAGLDTRDHGPAELAVGCGALFQDPETQVVMGTVRAELALGLENRGASATVVAREVEEVALALNIAELLERSTHELSGGELQRVALGAALVGRPPLICLDEPTSQLDPVAGDELIWLVRRLNEQWGTTVLLAEHRLERCLPAADRVVVFDRGRIVNDSPPREFLEWAAAASPALQTPAAVLFERAGLRPAPTGVKEARAILRDHGLLPDPVALGSPERTSEPPRHRRRLLPRRGTERRTAALELRGVWLEFSGGRSVLRGVDLRLAPGEKVALMGRNGAGKSTLMKVAHGLLEPTRGRVARAGQVALLLQNPGDYLVHDRVGDEAPEIVVRDAGLEQLADRHPRDLSGGERQRLALAIVTSRQDENPAVVCLDEPTRGMDRSHKGELVSLLAKLSHAGSGVLVATHDAELAAAFADRVVLLGGGRVIADGPAAEILAGGWYFATETARILGGAGDALEPAQGAEVIRGRLTIEAAP